MGKIFLVRLFTEREYRSHVHIAFGQARVHPRRAFLDDTDDLVASTRDSLKRLGGVAHG